MAKMPTFPQNCRTIGAWEGSMIVWSGDGLGAFVILLIWCLGGIAVLTFVANLIYPDSPDSLSLVFLNQAILVVIPITFAVVGSIHIWIWGRRVNADSVEHTLYGFPIESFPLLSMVFAISLAGYTLFTSPVDRATDQFERACKARWMDMNYPQCECLAAQLGENLPLPLTVALSRVASSNSRTPILERFDRNELPRFSPEDQLTFATEMENAFGICLPARP